MQVLITHLTRMYHGHICVAGLAKDMRTHIRPVLRDEGVPKGLHARLGGPLDVGRFVDFGVLEPCGDPPEIEDHYFSPPAVRHVGTASPEHLWSILETISEDSLRSIFGEALSAHPTMPQKLVTAEGCGRASLGVWRPGERVEVNLKGRHIRLSTTVDGVEKSLAVTDTSLFENDMLTASQPAVAAVKERLKDASEVLLCVGLGRAWTPEDSDLSPMHWLQVNGIHTLPKPVHAKGDRLQEIRRQHPRAYEPWSKDEDARLSQLFGNGVGVRDIAQQLQRQPSAIQSRLRKNGLTE